MCQRIGHRQSIFCVVPPHVLQAVVQNAEAPEDREAALNTLLIDGTQRTLRGIRLAAPVEQALAARVSAFGLGKVASIA